MHFELHDHPSWLTVRFGFLRTNMPATEPVDLHQHPGVHVHYALHVYYVTGARM
jgi:hypothetical protein